MAQLKMSTDVAKLHQMFGKKMYSSEFAFISEVCQNAVDSHRMAKEKDPVVVGIKKKDPSQGYNSRNLVFYVKDIGLSFTSTEDFDEKVGTLLASGKEEKKTDAEDCPMGKHGVGSIAVSAYSSNWKYTVITPDGKTFQAMFQEVQGKGIHVDYTEYFPTQEYQGVLFEVDVATEPGALSKLLDAMTEKLCYFKDIMFDLDSDIIKEWPGLLTLNSNFEIFQSEDFQISTLSKQSELHICLDQYTYPIKWSVLGITPIKHNVGLKFTMADGLESDITRENLICDDNYKDIIMGKIKKVSEWFCEHYNETFPDEYESVAEVHKAMNSPRNLEIAKRSYLIDDLVKHSSIGIKQIKFKGVRDLTMRKFISSTIGGTNIFSLSYEITPTGNKISKVSPFKTVGSFQEKFFINGSNIPTSKLNYLKSQVRGAGLFTMKKIPLFTTKVQQFSLQHILGFPPKDTMKSIYKTTGLNLWRTCLEEGKLLVDSAIKDHFVRIEDLVIPSNFKTAPKKKANRKAAVDITNLTGELGIKYACPTLVSTDWACKFTEKTVEIKDLAGLGMHVYGTEDKRYNLDKLYEFTHYGNKYKLNICTISERQQKYIKELKLTNFMEVDEFFKGKHDMFRKIVTSHLIQSELCLPYSKIFEDREIIKKYLCTDFGKDLHELRLYADNYKTTRSGYSDESTLMKSMVDLAHEAKLYDTDVWEKFNNVKEDIEKFDFVRYLSYEIKIEKDGDKAVNALGI